MTPIAPIDIPRLRHWIGEIQEMIQNLRPLTALSLEEFLKDSREKSQAGFLP